MAKCQALVWGKNGSEFCGQHAVIRYLETNYCIDHADAHVLAAKNRIGALTGILAAAALSFPPEMAMGFKEQIQLNGMRIKALEPKEE